MLGSQNFRQNRGRYTKTKSKKSFLCVLLTSLNCVFFFYPEDFGRFLGPGRKEDPMQKHDLTLEVTAIHGEHVTDRGARVQKRNPSALSLSTYFIFNNFPFGYFFFVFF